jgi:predicted nucleic acid-binding protein
MSDFEKGSLVYIDSNIFIYFIEMTPGFLPLVKNLFAQMAKSGATAVTSQLTLAECIYQPSRNEDPELVLLYESLFEKSGDVEMLALDGALLKRAALNGGALGLKLLDAIHFISALEAGCDFFVTADSAFKSGPAMKVLRLAA